MLKIKDNVDLKELEKFGFYPNEYNSTFLYYQADDSEFELSRIVIENKQIIFRLQNASFCCDSIDRLEIDYYRIKRAYEKFKKVVVDLIKADLVEKVEE